MDSIEAYQKLEQAIEASKRRMSDLNTTINENRAVYAVKLAEHDGLVLMGDNAPKVEQLRETDSQLADDIELLRRMLEG